MNTATMPQNTDQAFFDFLVPVTKELLRVDEVMTILRMEKDTVYALVDGGKLEAHQERMKAVNKAVKKNDRAALEALNVAASMIDLWLSPEPVEWPGRGFPAFELTNNNANSDATRSNNTTILPRR
jgi:hypothetical protein